MPRTADMGRDPVDASREKVGEIYRSESRRVFATLVRLLGDFDLAEEALHNAFAAALEQWPRAGVPDNPRAWLVSVGRFNAIDTLRRRARFDAALTELADRLDHEAGDPDIADEGGVEDDRLRLIFTEGYSASAGDSLTPPDLSGEAIRLGRLLVALLPEPDAIGLLALMLLQDSRHEARTTPDGDLIPLEEQDRALWNRRRIAEGISLVRRALSQDRFGPYTIQAAIAAVHAQAPSVAATDWAQIVSLYDLLLRMGPSPV